MKHISKKISIIVCLFILFQGCSNSDQASNPTTFQIPATENIVMYEVNINAFSNTKNLQGISNRLDNIKALGINTIWLMPIYEVGILNSFGSLYCVRDYKAMNPNFGTLQNLKDLVTAAHEKNIAVILDWVANHTAWDNAWITAHPEWYTKNSSGQIISPAGTNWNDVADLNYDNTSMRLSMIDAMKYWVTNADIDGFRCDAADFVPFDFWEQAINSLNSIPDKHLILLAEGSRADHFTAGFQMNFSWDYLNSVKSVFGSTQTNANFLYTTNVNEYAVVPSRKQKLRFTTNHDESNQATPITLYGGNSGALAASVVTIFMQGVPLIYCGQEVGVTLPSTYNGSSVINWNGNSGMLSSYQKLFAFYNTSDAARTGTLTNYSTADIAAFVKSNTVAKVLVIVNTRSTSKSFTIANELEGTWTNAITNESVSISGNLSLTGFQYLVLKR